MDEKRLAPSIRADVLEELVQAMRMGLLTSAEHLEATSDEVCSAVFSMTLRTIHAAVEAQQHNLENEFKTRKNMTIICEKLWMVAAGEPFMRHERKRDKRLPC